MSSKLIRLAGGQGYYGDGHAPVTRLLEDGVDYLCLEALGELSLVILEKNRQRDGDSGYTRDFPDYLELALPFVADRQTKIVTNSGGMNPRAAAAVASRMATERGMRGVRVASITGDSLTSRVRELAGLGVELENLETGQPWTDFPDDESIIFASAYIGAAPVVEALRGDADIVVGGRLADPTLFLAPLIHEFGWSFNDWDHLALGTVLGHLCECSAQSTGGNYAGSWWTIPGPWDVGYPIGECDGTNAYVTKAQGTGGRVDFDSTRQQLLYEIHDTAAYLTPDCVADMSSVRLTDLGHDRVQVSEVEGRSATDTYKLLIASAQGWGAETRIAFSWPDAYEKAVATAAIFRRLTRDARLETEEWREEYWGIDALHGGTVPSTATTDVAEIVLRIAWRCADQKTAAAIGALMSPLRLSGPPPAMTLAGFYSMASRPTQLLSIWPTLVPKDYVDDRLSVELQVS